MKRLLRNIGIYLSLMNDSYCPQVNKFVKQLIDDVNSGKAEVSDISNCWVYIKRDDKTFAFWNENRWYAFLSRANENGSLGKKIYENKRPSKKTMCKMADLIESLDGKFPIQFNKSYSIVSEYLTH